MGLVHFLCIYTKTDKSTFESHYVMSMPWILIYRWEILLVYKFSPKKKYLPCGFTAYFAKLFIKNARNLNNLCI